MLFAYSLGKAQRVLAELAREPLLGPIVGHGAICAMNEVYERSGVALPPVEYIDDRRGKALHGHLVMAPPSVRGGPWMRRFSNASLGYVSGWMRVRGQRRRRSVDRGFVLSDHADWPALLRTIEETGAQKIRLLNGATALARHLREQGVDAEVIQ